MRLSTSQVKATFSLSLYAVAIINDFMSPMRENHGPCARG